MRQITLKSHAKVNLTLDVLSKRRDGYHDVRMIMQTVNLCDTINMTEAYDGIEVMTNLPYLPVDSRNIAYKAAQIFFDATGLKGGVKIRIEKAIPVSAGLAGGSGNAAAVLIGLNELYGKPLDIRSLSKITHGLGTDVPYCMLGGTMLAEGIGSVLTALPALPDCCFVLAKPPFSVSTADVYGRVTTVREHPDTRGAVEALKNGDLKGVAIRLFNVLESVTAPRFPVLYKLKDILFSCGALGASMSGSGPTVFGLFDNNTKAEEAYLRLKNTVNDVFICKPSVPDWMVN